MSNGAGKSTHIFALLGLRAHGSGRITVLSRNAAKHAAAIRCSVGIIAEVRLWYLEELSNFHPITFGDAYRSAQLDQDELEYCTSKFVIRSIINLNGKSEG